MYICAILKLVFMFWIKVTSWINLKLQINGKTDLMNNHIYDELYNRSYSQRCCKTK